MLYESLKKVINAENKRYKENLVTTEEYEHFRENTIKKMDMFVVMNRITTTQYEELSDMFITTTA